MKNIKTILAITSILACLSILALISCGSDSPSPVAPSTTRGPTSVTVAGDLGDDDASDQGSDDGRSVDGTDDNFSDDNKSDDGASGLGADGENDGDSSGDGDSFGRASGGYDGVNFRANVQSHNSTCPPELTPPCMIIVLKNVPVIVLNETEIWDFRDPSRPQITIEAFHSILHSSDSAGGTVNVKGEGQFLEELDGVSLDGDDVPEDTFVAIEVDVLEATGSSSGGNSDPNIFCDEGLCATNDALKNECVQVFNTCIATNSDANDDECVAAALLICEAI